jgi:hypothetical protein
MSLLTGALMRASLTPYIPPFDNLREEIANEFDKHFERSNEENDMFLPGNALKMIMSRHQVARLVKSADSTTVNSKVVDLILQDRLKIAAILIYCRCEKARFKALLERGTNDLDTRLDDEDLPYSRKACYHMFGTDIGRAFFAYQLIFCPIVFEHRAMAVYKGNKSRCRKPYMVKPTNLGQGSWGIIDKVIIAPDHFKSSDRNQPWSNDKPNLFCSEEV